MSILAPNVSVVAPFSSGYAGATVAITFSARAFANSSSCSSCNAPIWALYSNASSYIALVASWTSLNGVKLSLYVSSPTCPYFNVPTTYLNGLAAFDGQQFISIVMTLAGGSYSTIYGAFAINGVQSTWYDGNFCVSKALSSPLSLQIFGTLPALSSVITQQTALSGAVAGALATACGLPAFACGLPD